MEYWITHPGLTPEHDHKIDAGALAMMTRSGWHVRDDQDDPVEVIPADPAAAPAGVDTPDGPAAAIAADDTDPPASGPEPSTTKKKGEV